MKKSERREMENEHSIYLIDSVSRFLVALKQIDYEVAHPPKSKQMASKIIKEWADSISKNMSNDKEIIKNKAKYLKLLKSIASFLE